MDFNWDDAKTGAVVGGVAGTAVMPGLGTAVGAVGGGLIGGIGGFGGGLWNTVSGQYDANKAFGDKGITGADQKMQANEATLHGWANAGEKDQYGNLVNPNVPSAAQDLLERNRSTGQQRAVSNVKAMVGNNDPGLVANLASKQQAQVSADTGLQSATLRAQEQQNAMQAYQAALERRRQQDIDMATKKAEIGQKNAENNSKFIGSLMGGAGNVMGGMM